MVGNAHPTNLQTPRSIKQRCRAVAEINLTQFDSSACAKGDQLRQRGNSARSTLTLGGLEGGVMPSNGGSGGLVPQHQLA
jgi:hypothetical protein